MTLSFRVHSWNGFELFTGEYLVLFTVGWLSATYYAADLHEILSRAIIGSSGLESLIEKSEEKDELEPEEMIDAIRFGLKRYTNGSVDEHIDDYLHDHDA